jgi:hypothetical protein
MDKAEKELVLNARSRGVRSVHLRGCNRRNGGDVL